MIGQPGELYAVAKGFGIVTRYLAAGSVKEVQKVTSELSWSASRENGKPFTYADARLICQAVPGAFIVRAVATPPPQQELSLW